MLGGLAHDRGLYVPEELPTVTPAELANVCRGCHSIMFVDIVRVDNVHSVV